MGGVFTAEAKFISTENSLRREMMHKIIQFNCKATFKVSHKTLGKIIITFTFKLILIILNTGLKYDL